jgi:hypothetical protein
MAVGQATWVARGRTTLACFFALLVGFAHARPAAAQSDLEFQSAFDEIMLAPTAPAPNMRYARIAIARGELRKALAAYERILAGDPTNAEALAGRDRILRQLEPETTRFLLAINGYYQTNPRHANASNSLTDDGSYGGRFSMVDERRLFSLRWRTEADVFGTRFVEFRDLDIASFGGRTGPVLPFSNLRRVHFFVGGSYNMLDGRTFFTEPTAGLNFEFDDLGPFRGVTVRWGYQLLGRHLTSRDGTFVEIYPRFVFSDVAFKGSTLTVVPFWRYNGVVGSGQPVEPFGLPFPSRLHQLGVRADYVVTLFPHFAVGVNGSYEYRHYFEQFTAETHHRRDHVVVPGGQLILFGLAGNRFDLIASYNFEHRTSNDGVARYNNHIAGLRGQWRF